MNGVGVTGLLVAAIRAEENERKERLFSDPFAHALAGERGRAALAQYRAASPRPHVPVIEVRTRFYDEAVARAVANGIRQFVLLAAGMDARAYRLSWPTECRVFELDQPAVLAHKASVLAAAQARVAREGIACDLATDWTPALRTAGFDANAPSCFLVEGVLQYLPEAAARGLMQRLGAVAAPGSVAIFDVVGESMLSSSFVAATRDMMRELGAPWLFGCEEPSTLLPGWSSDVTQPGILGNAWGRWPFPMPPPGVRGVPRGYLIEARNF